jgi:hypothetical protein
VAKQYVTTGSFQTVKVLSQNQVLDVEAIGIQTIPSGVRCTVPVPLAAFRAGNADDYLSLVADLVEALIAGGTGSGGGEVSGASGSQNIDANGLLSYYINFTVTYTPTTTQQGSFSEVVSLPVSSFESEDGLNTPVNGVLPLVAIANAYNRQKALANA